MVLLIPTLARADGNDQPPKRIPYFGIRAQSGILLQFANEVDAVFRGNPWALELDMGWHYLSERAWQYCFCYPRVGAMFTYYNYSRPDVLGEGFGVTPYIEPFLSADRPLSVSIRAGVGLIYLNNQYHPETNPDNIYYSTPISFLLVVNIGLNYRLTPSLNMNLGAYFNHISNGSISQPNRGLDYPMASLGMDYSFPSPAFPLRTRNDYQVETRGDSWFRVAPFFTLKETTKDDENTYPVYGLGAKYSRLVGRLSAITAGADWIWDGSIKEIIARDSIPNTDPNRLGITAGHELLIGRFNFYQELGVYLYAPYKARHPVYQRYGLEIFLSRNISVGACLKAHLKVADFLDFRVTYSF